MKCYHKMLMVSLLAIPLQSPIAFAEPASDYDCWTGGCEHQLYSQKPRNGGRRGERNPEQLREQLNLSDQQVQQLNSIRQKYRPQMEPLQQKIRQARQELGKMMQGNASVSEIRAKHQEVINLDQQLHNLRFESMLEMREALTPEQREKFAQLMDQRRENRRNRRSSQPTP